MSEILVVPVVSLLGSTVLPGEAFCAGLQELDERLIEAFLEATPKEVVAVGISSRVEVPMLLGGRWGTICEVVEVGAHTIHLRGKSRVKIVEVEGKRPPYQANVQIEEPGEDDEDMRVRARKGAQLLAAVAAGAEPGRTDWRNRLPEALVGVVRALCSDEDSRKVVEEGFVGAVEVLAAEMGKGTQARQAVDELESMMRELVATPKTDRQGRARLWSQVVALQKRLDVYEPMGDGDPNDDLTNLQRKLSQAGLSAAARRHAKRELRLLRGTSKSHHDYTVHLRHLEFMAGLPWHSDPVETPALRAVKEALDSEHSGLSEPKRRILEYLAVRQLEGRTTGLVLCLVGPPGVGKTSLVRSIARALARPFVRVALGGMHDESELRGHRLSFVAASPGRIMDGVSRAGSRQALMLLDELDKVSISRNRSPAAALLEVLDPEQNSDFRDNYLGCGFDLSEVLFIATANDASEIPGPLLDRLEMIELEGYTTGEKLTIAKEHLLPEMAKEHGLSEELEVDDGLITHLIEGYTREAGVRELQRVLASLHRARALNEVMGEGGLREATMETVTELLGPPRYRMRERLEHLTRGVASGLSVSRGGGALLFVEVVRVPGKGQLKLTGKQGDVMQEAAHTALALLRSNPQRFGLSADDLVYDFHIHLPEAAVPKDGPSAGIATLAALLSVCRDVALRADVAMTGELTLTGRVLAVGGVRAKLLAAERAQMSRVILPADNAADIPEDLTTEVVLVETIEDALAVLF